MRALFLLILTLLLAFLVFLGIQHAGTIKSRMILNRAIYENNSGNFRAALSRTTALLERKPDYRPALETAIGWLVARRQYKDARALAARFAAPRALSPTVRYQLAVCAYQVGDESEARSLMESLAPVDPESDDPPAALVKASLAFVRGDFETALALLGPRAGEYGNDPLYHSLVGRSAYARGDFARATAELQRAIVLGGRNPNGRLALALSQALEGDRAALDRLLDTMQHEGVDAYGLAQREMQGWLARFGSMDRYASEAQESGTRARLIRMSLADASIDVEKGRRAEARDKLFTLLVDHRDVLGLATQLGLLLEEERHVADAVEFYRLDSDRLLLAAYKVATLSPDTAPASQTAVWRQFLTTGSLVCEAKSMHPSGGEPRGIGWGLQDRGDFTTLFTAPSAGYYTIGLIARGERAESIWPIAALEINGCAVAELYVNSPVWQLFEARVPLLAGRHAVRILFANSAVTPGAPAVRHLALDKVIIRPEWN